MMFKENAIPEETNSKRYSMLQRFKNTLGRSEGRRHSVAGKATVGAPLAFRCACMGSFAGKFGHRTPGKEKRGGEIASKKREERKDRDRDRDRERETAREKTEKESEI